MFIITIKDSKAETLLILKTEVRSQARAVEAVAKSSGYSAQTTVEIPKATRIVKFKGVD